MRKPGQQHVLLEMMLVDLLLEMLAQLAFAEDHESRVGDLLHDEVRRVDEMPLAFVRHERGDVADDRRVVGSQNASCTFTAGAASTCSTSMPSCTVTVRSAGTPSATSIWRIASDAAMKQSDLPVLPA